ncbi:hypothetical protein RFI_14936 [Reticulomyxa filosa]|uniref:Uncharacterized protein n=1 Tax=Reticulomyxa filosa TaxID=46433 RepID=X6NAC9_RETFI|nr:hypothetical protein RFI_14936 [Reticulomyxa filosa]|eukprot:ETO22267.1 hypothetical protein RFI_14936 [Reticulomyxa filosa]
MGREIERVEYDIDSIFRCMSVYFEGKQSSFCEYKQMYAEYLSNHYKSDVWIQQLYEQSKVNVPIEEYIDFLKQSNARYHRAIHAFGNDMDLSLLARIHGIDIKIYDAQTLQIRCISGKVTTSHCNVMELAWNRSHFGLVKVTSIPMVCYFLFIFSSNTLFLLRDFSFENKKKDWLTFRVFLFFFLKKKVVDYSFVINQQKLEVYLTQRVSNFIQNMKKHNTNMTHAQFQVLERACYVWKQRSIHTHQVYLFSNRTNSNMQNLYPMFAKLQMLFKRLRAHHESQNEKKEQKNKDSPHRKTKKVETKHSDDEKMATESNEQHSLEKILLKKTQIHQDIAQERQKMLHLLKELSKRNVPSYHSSITSICQQWSCYIHHSHQAKRLNQVADNVAEIEEHFNFGLFVFSTNMLRSVPSFSQYEWNVWPDQWKTKCVTADQNALDLYQWCQMHCTKNRKKGGNDEIYEYDIFNDNCVF